MATVNSHEEFERRLQLKHADLQSLFLLLADDKEQLELDSAKHGKALINEVARLVQWQVVNVDIPVLTKSFQAFLETHAPSPILTLPVFLEAITAWHRDNPIPLSEESNSVQQGLVTRLRRTIAEYKGYLANARGFEAEQCEQLLSALQKQLADLTGEGKLHFAISLNREPTEEEKKGLSEIFRHYATQHQMMGKAPTFDAVAYNNAVIDSGSFLHFCKDFGLWTEKAEGQRTMLRDELLNIFKKSALMRRHMVLEGFLVALDLLADEFFNEVYNGLHPGPCDCTAMPLEQKRIMLYELLKCGDPRHYLKLCKPFGRAFASSIDVGSRIPLDDPSRRYRYQRDDRTKDRLLKYQEEKRLKMEEMKAAERQKEAVKVKQAQHRLKEKMEVEEGRRNKSLLKLEDLPNMSFKDLLGEDSGDLDALVDGSAEF